MDTEVAINRVPWQHQEGDRYAPVQPHIVGNPEAGYSQTWSSHGKHYQTLKEAISAGFSDFGSDDFNVVVIRHGRLVAKLWMEQDHLEPPETLTEIARQIGVLPPPKAPEPAAGGGQACQEGGPRCLSPPTGTGTWP